VTLDSSYYAYVHGFLAVHSRPTCAMLKASIFQGVSLPFVVLSLGALHQVRVYYVASGMSLVPSNGRLFRGGAASTSRHCLNPIVYSLLHHAAYNSSVQPTHGHCPTRAESLFEYDFKFASPRRESCSISRRTNIVAEQSLFSESSMGVFNTLRLFSSNQVYVYL